MSNPPPAFYGQGPAVADNFSLEMVECAEVILQSAREGKLRGLVFGGLLDNGTHIANACGTAYTDPLHAMKSIASVVDHLTYLLRGEPSPYHATEPPEMPASGEETPH